MKKDPGVRVLPDGRFEVRVTRTENGRQYTRKRRLPASTSRADLLRVRAELIEQLETGETSNRAGPTTVAHYAQRWIAQLAPTHHPSTRAKYVNALSAHILPYIGEVRVDALDRFELQDMVNAWARDRKPDGQPYTRQSVGTWWAIVRRLVRDIAADHGTTDPCSRVVLEHAGGPKVQEHRTLTVDELVRLLEAVSQHYPAWYAEVVMLAQTGMRPGELYGLEWRDVDVARRCVHIRRAAVRGEVGRTKTAGSQRTAPLTQEVMTALIRHRTDSIAKGRSVVGDAPVFVSAEGSRRYASSLRNTLRRASVHAGLDIAVTARVLRRTVNSRLLELGIAPTVVRSQLGHVTDRMTDHYAEIHVDAQRSAMGALWSKVTGGLTTNTDHGSNIVPFRARTQEDES